MRLLSVLGGAKRLFQGWPLLWRHFGQLRVFGRWPAGLKGRQIGSELLGIGSDFLDARPQLREGRGLGQHGLQAIGRFRRWHSTGEIPAQPDQPAPCGALGALFGGSKQRKDGRGVKPSATLAPNV
jgi:hypothetical protein